MKATEHTLLGKVFHWGFVLLYAYGIFKQINDLSELDYAGLSMFEILFGAGSVLLRAEFILLRRRILL